MLVNGRFLSKAAEVEVWWYAGRYNEVKGDANWIEVNLGSVVSDPLRSATEQRLDSWFRFRI